MRRRKTSKYFIRFLISYLLVLLLPAIFIFKLFSNLYFQEMRKKISRDNYLISYMFEEDMGRVLDGMGSIVNNLGYYQAVAPFPLSRYPSKAISLQDTLKKYLVTNEILDEIGVHFFMDSYIYTNRSSYTKDNYVKYLDLQAGDRVDFLKKIQEVNGPGFYQGSRQDGTKSLIYLRPYLYQGEKEGAIWFSINQGEMEKLLANLPGNSRKTALFDQSWRMLAGQLPGDIERADVLWLLHQAAGGQGANMEKGQYQLEAKQLEGHPLYYLRAIPDQDLFAKLKGTRRQYILIMGIALLLGSLVIVWLARRFYRPIGSLKKLVSADGVKGDEFSCFESAYSNLKARNEELYGKWRESMKLLQQYLLSCLISGSAGGQEDFMEQAEDCGLSLSAPWYHVVINLAKGRNQEEVKELLAGKASITCFYLCLSLEDCQVYAMGTQARQPDIIWESLQQMGIAVSSPVQSVFGLSAAYAKARILSGQDQVKHQDMGWLKHWSTSRYDGILGELATCLLSGSWMAIHMLLESLEKALGEDEAPLEVRKLVYYQVIRLLQKNSACSQTGSSGNELADQVLMAPGLSVLCPLVSGEIQRSLDQLKKDSPKPSLSLEKIVDYVNRHFADHDFSLKLVADHFQVSISYISLFFKNAYGSKLMDYYTSLRMERAIQLMGTTSLGLSEIMMEVGYFNLSSFIRRFKQLYGITPGEYKKLYIEKK